jgi:hypothetical protein
MFVFHTTSALKFGTVAMYVCFGVCSGKTTSILNSQYLALSLQFPFPKYTDLIGEKIKKVFLHVCTFHLNY